VGRGQVLGLDVVDRVHARALGAGLERRAEGGVGDQLPPGLGRQPAGAAEVVGVRVGDDHGMDPLDRDAGLGQALPERLPRGRAGETGIDERGTPAVEQGVGVDVAEPGQGDRQLHAEDARAHLGHLGGGGLLFLLSRSAHRTGTVLDRPVKSRR
jgi:hypothetical protein